MRLIAAVDQNWGLGYQGELLFTIPADMRHFRETTKDHVVVMGRKTLATLPNGKPLKNRTNIILTRDSAFTVEDAQVCRSLAELAAVLEQYQSDEVYVIGGADVYCQLLDYCDQAIITHIDCSKEADRFLPDLSKREGWIKKQVGEVQEHEDISFVFVIYENQQVKSLQEKQAEA